MAPKRKTRAQAAAILRRTKDPVKQRTWRSLVQTHDVMQAAAERGLGVKDG